MYGSTHAHCWSSNADPAVIPCLAKGISAGRYIDLALAYSLGAGLTPDVTCRFDREEGTGSRREFFVGCPNALAHLMPVMSLIGGSLLTFQFLLAFVLVPGRLTLLARLHASLFGLLVGLTLLMGPLCRLLVLSRMFGTSMGMSLGWFQRRLLRPSRMLPLGLRWMIFELFGAEMLNSVYLRHISKAGGPVVAGSSSFLGRGQLRIRSRCLGGRAVGGKGSSRLHRTCQGDEVDKHCAQFFVNSSLSPVLLLRRRLKSVADVLKGIRSKGFTQSRWDALHRYWDAACRHGPCGPISSLHPWDCWVPPGLHGFYWWVFDSLEVLFEFLKQVVVSRRDVGVRKWTRWLREDLSSRPYVWLPPDFVHPLPFLVFKDPQNQSSRILVEPHLIDAEFRKAWMPFFCRSGFCWSSLASGALSGSSQVYGS